MEWKTWECRDDDKFYINKYYKFKNYGSGLTEASYMEFINFKFKIHNQKVVYKLVKIEEAYLIFEY